ncbi:MAG: 2-phosphosulfolactate phosphatase [Sphingobacteriales bacterium]|jgi:2-phosphosulfolactate phosphatase
MRSIETVLSPELLHLYDLKGKIVVVIDVLRATSSMSYGIANGAESIIPVATVEECLSFKGKENYLLAAERDGEIVEGFNMGNSPYDYTEDKVKGKTVVLTTTNGTKALKKSLDADKIIVSSFLNVAATSQWLLEQKEDVILLASGWKGKVNLEDSLLCGAIYSRVKDHFPTHDDSCQAFARLYDTVKDNLGNVLYISAHYNRLKSLGIEKDVKFCLQEDICNVVPIYRDGKLLAF